MSPSNSFSSLPPRSAQAARFAIAALRALVALAKLLFGWAWLSSWPISSLLLVMALVCPFIGRSLPGRWEIAANVVRVVCGLCEILKWVAEASWWQA